MIINYHATKQANITSRLIGEIHRDNLPPIQIELTPTDYFYLERDEAYALYNALESVLHQLAQEVCDHPLDEQDASAGITTCLRCGELLVAPTIEELM